MEMCNEGDYDFFSLWKTVNPLYYIFPYKISCTLQDVVPVTDNCSYCTVADGYVKYAKHVE
jgi:hypothetical protein